jgi:hypothetical protein
VEYRDKSHACQKKGQKEAEIVGVIDGAYEQGEKQEGEQHPELGGQDEDAFSVEDNG